VSVKNSSASISRTQADVNICPPVRKVGIAIVGKEEEKVEILSVKNNEHAGLEPGGPGERWGSNPQLTHRPAGAWARTSNCLANPPGETLCIFAIFGSIQGVRSFEVDLPLAQ
jgi:hypothetical protein